MSENRYSELKFDGKVYTEQWQISEILIKNKFNWMVNAEIKNARLEIFQDTLIWNAGIWYNGDWYFGVWRDGEWRYGTWQNGVWYNGVWKNGTFKSGIIYNGKFFKGKIESGEIRGGRFIDIEIDKKVTEYTSDEYQAKKQEQTEVKTQTQIQPQSLDRVRVTGTKSNAQVGLQQEKKNNNKMKHLKNFESYVDSAEELGLYDQMSDLLDRASELCNCEISDPEEALNALGELGTDDADLLATEIQELQTEIDEAESESYFNEEDDEYGEEDEEYGEDDDDDDSI